MIVAVSIEHCDLHRRIALNAMRLVGTTPRMLMLSFMLPTSMLSMWISNTATTAMMIPIMEAILEELEAQRPEEENEVEKEARDARMRNTRLDNISLLRDSMLISEG